MIEGNSTGFRFFTDEALDILFIKYCMYTIEGLILTFANLPVLLAIVRQQLLRQKKEYIVTAGMYSHLLRGTELIHVSVTMKC